MKSDIKLGRLVQCRCSHTCLPNSSHGFQWLLPRTKSKHMMYEYIQQKNQKATSTTVEQLEALFSLFTYNDKPKSRLKKQQKKRTFKMPICWKRNSKEKQIVTTVRLF
ncbi:unnamed protein product [Mucor hiemalis]